MLIEAYQTIDEEFIWIGAVPKPHFVLLDEVHTYEGSSGANASYFETLEACIIVIKLGWFISIIGGRRATF